MSVKTLKEVVLDEIACFTPGFAFKSEDFGKGDTKVIKITNIIPPNIDIDNASFVDVTRYDIKKLKKYFVHQDDIVIAMTGATIGKIGRNRTSKTAILNQRVCKIEPINDICDKDYLYYFLNSSEFTKHVRNFIDSESAQANISATSLGKYKSRIHDFSEQKFVGKVLRSIDDKIELNNKINKTLEEMAQAIFKSWFVDFEPFKDGEFVESEHGFIPKGWKVTNFSQYYDYVAGYSYSGDELVSSKTALLTIKNFDRNGGLRNDGFKEINPIKKVKEEKYAKLFDVVVACTDLTQKAEIIGNPLLVTSSAEYESMIFSMDLVKILPTTEMADSCFAYQILKDQRFKGFALKYVSGTTVLHLSKKAFNEYLLPLPYDFEIIQKYVEIVRPMFEKLVEIESENNRLIKVRDSLLPKLMSGEIRVPFEGVPNAELR